MIPVRKLGVALSLVAAVALFLIAPASTATAASLTSTASPTIATQGASQAAGQAATWLAQQVNAQGFIPQAADPTKANLSTSAQAVLALASAGVGRAQVDALLAYLGAHVDEFAVNKGNDDPGALGYLILAAVAGGQSSTDFGSGHADLVSRLEATRQPDGLFGAADPSFDGAFRQGVALLALGAAGQTDAAAADWLTGQQCADGSWTAFRADTTKPCPAVDPATFTGPDTNSTALASLGLDAQGRTAAATKAANALTAVRNAGGAWGFLARADQATDANSTGLVVTALRTITGTQDAAGVAAILALQVGCDGATADVGGIAFQPAPTGLVPDALASAQATPALAGVGFPLQAPTISSSLAAPCPAAATTSTTALPTTPTTASTTSGTAPTTFLSTPASAASVGANQLARTGAPTVFSLGAALVLVGCGGVFVHVAWERRRRHA